MTTSDDETDSETLDIGEPALDMLQRELDEAHSEILKIQHELEHGPRTGTVVDAVNLLLVVTNRYGRILRNFAARIDFLSGHLVFTPGETSDDGS